MSQRSRRQTVRGKVKRTDASWCIGESVCIGGERERKTQREREREYEEGVKRKRERERGESGNCLFADDFEFPPLHFFSSPPTLHLFCPAVRLWVKDTSSTFTPSPPWPGDNRNDDMCRRSDVDDLEYPDKSIPDLVTMSTWCYCWVHDPPPKWVRIYVSL